MKNILKRKGFTLIEIMVSITILSVLFGSSVSIYMTMQKTQLRVKVANKLFNDTRFLMESLAREIRAGYIDYEEYYNQKINSGSCELDCSFTGDCGLVTDECSGATYNNNETYGVIGECYGAYARTFYEDENSSRGVCSKDIKATGLGETAFNNNSQNSLYLINLSGTERTYFKLNGSKIEKLKLTCDELAGDICKKWKKNTDYSDFVDITPGSIEIKYLNFEIYPNKDPYLAFKDTNSKYHPYVRISLKTHSKDYATQFPSETAPNISLSTTVSVRSYKNVRSFL